MNSEIVGRQAGCIAVLLRKQQANIIVHCSAIEQEAEHVMSCSNRLLLS